MDDLLRVIEGVFLWSSSIYILLNAYLYSPYLSGVYLIFLALVVSGWIKLGSTRNMFFASPLAIVNGFLYATILLSKMSVAQGPFVQLSASVFASTTNPSAPLRTDLILPGTSNRGAPVIPNIIDPEAVDAQTVCPGYKATSFTRNPHGLTATLALAGDACNVYGNDVDVLNLTVEYQAKDRLSVKIQPANINSTTAAWYILPEYLVPTPGLEGPSSGNEPLNNQMGFFWNNNPSFYFKVVRLSTGDILFSTQGTKLVYEDQFIEFASTLPENYNLYGLGETIHGLRLGNNFTKTFWAADIGDPIDGNIYGSHPFYVDTRYFEIDKATGDLTLVTSNISDPKSNYVSYSHGVYNRNAHGQDVLLRPTNITWRAIGGSVDLYFYSGPTVKDVISSYQNSASGLPAMQQYFTFGYHQCRWGYSNWTVLQTVIDKFNTSGIPLETIWTDIDYMEGFKDFDNDPVRFGYSEGKELIDKLHANNQHYVPIVDSAIYHPNPNDASDVYEPFDRGLATNSFMLNPDGSLYVGQVWPGYTVFPDWLPGSGANAWWINEMSAWHAKINWSGIWIDMNEVSSFCVGSCGSSALAQDSTTAISIDAVQQNQQQLILATATTSSMSYLRTKPTPGVRNINHPPYAINNIYGDLAVQAVSPNATHHDSTAEYDVHNLFGAMILNATYNALLKIFPGKRPFIIGRSTFVGSGRHAGHWGGDNASRWYYMFFSIPQAFQFSIAGIPMFGVDTCGFQQDTTEELCNRWMQLSAFFPFYRNHNDYLSTPQEPYTWASVTEATKIALSIRFQLLPYIYTLFEAAHTTGSTVMRALAWEFPNDPTLANADRQFFLGPAILVTPVLDQGASSVKGVFPGVGQGEVYYDWYSKAPVTGVSPCENVTISAPLGHIPVFVRGGYVLPMQQPANTTEQGRNTPWSVLVALNLGGEAKGSLYLDDGESLVPNSTLTVDLAATLNSLTAYSSGDYIDRNPLADIAVLGAMTAPTGKVTLNGMPVGRSSVTYNASSKVLAFVGLQEMTGAGAWKADWVLKW